MLTRNCDNCNKPIEAPDDAAGKKVKCPHCGDINLFAPSAVSEPASKDRRTSTPEEIVLKLRPEMFRARPLTFLGLLAGLVGGGAGGVYFAFWGSSSVTAWICFGVAGVALGILGVWKIKNLGSSLQVTNKRTIERVGLFSRYTSEIMHDDVRNVQITQSFVERIMGIGRIGISSAGQEGLEIQIKDIRNPDRIRETIDRYRPM